MRNRIALSLAAASLLLTAEVRAQTAGSFTDVPDRFRIEVGGFRIASDTELQFSRPGSTPTEVHFENDLDLPDASVRGYLEGFWRAGRRHLLSLGYARISRDGDGVTLDRDVTWGDQVFSVGTTVQGHVGSDYLSGVYRFAAYRNDKVEVGPALGFGLLTAEAGIRTEGTRSIDETASMTQPTGSLGGYLYWWPARRLLFRGDMRYILVKPGDSEASITDGRGSLVYHPWRQWGIGLQYSYTKFRYERGLLSTKLGGAFRYAGGQLVLGYAF